MLHWQRGLRGLLYVYVMLTTSLELADKTAALTVSKITLQALATMLCTRRRHFTSRYISTWPSNV